jgi:tetratricopeptide (TPR) repeat protein
MTTRLRIAAIACGLFLAAAAARADSAEEAKQRFQDGVAQFKDGKYEEAAAAFDKAYALKPTYKLLFNIGQARAAAGQYDLALQAFEQYLVDGKDDIDGARRDEVLAEINKIRPLVGFIEVEAPDGLTVSVDGMDRGVTPLTSKIRATVGHAHHLEVRDKDRVVLGKEIEVLGGTVEHVAVQEAAGMPASAATEARPAAQPAPVAAEEKGTGPLTPWGWATLGVGAAAIVAGATCGGLALSQAGTLDKNCPGGHCAPARSSEVDALASLSLSADVLVGVGAAAAAAGLLMVLLDPGSGGEKPAAAVRPAGTGLRVDF